MVEKNSNLSKKIEHLQKLSNRANTRLREQEKRNFKNNAYYEALTHIQELGGIGTRFSRSKKLDEQQVETQLKYVQQYLYDETSTYKGHKKSLGFSDYKLFDVETMSNMNRKDLEREYQRQARHSNKLIDKLDKNGRSDDTRARGRAKHFLNNDDLERYPTSLKDIKKMSDSQLKLYLQSSSRFNNYRTNNERGIIEQNFKQGLIFDELNYSIPLEKQQAFFDFVSSQVGKDLLKKIDSHQTFEEWSEFLQAGYSVDEIKEKSLDFLTDNSMTPDEYFELFETHTKF